MSSDYFDRLEGELRAAVPRAADTDPTSQRPRDRRSRWRPRPGSMIVVLSTVVTVAVVLAAVGLLGHHHTPRRSPALQHRGAGPRAFQYPLGAVPTLTQLMGNFAVLRRAQTNSDRSWHPQCDCGAAARQLNRLTRLATTLPSGYRVYLDVEQFIAGGQLNMAAGSYILNFDVVDPHGSTSSAAFGPNTGFTVFPISSGGNDAVWVSVVPDGVSAVRWTFNCPGGRRVSSSCGAIRSRTYAVTVANNVAARQVPNAGNCGSCASPQQISWQSADGRVVASFRRSLNLVAPPFVKGSRGPRVLRILTPTRLAGASIGESATAATHAIQQLLGPPADSHVRAGGCGIDHESVWTSPASAEPLTVFEREGLFVGYQYGAPATELGLVRGPGAILATSSGLTLADTVAVGRRLYGRSFQTSAAHGGIWRIVDNRHALSGSVEPITYPLRKVTGKNPIATIDAGMTSCPSNGNSGDSR